MNARVRQSRRHFRTDRHPFLHPRADRARALLPIAQQAAATTRFGSTSAVTPSGICIA